MYYLLLVILYPISWLPFFLLYRISDLGYFIIYHILGYRKEVVWDNLKHAYPAKTDAELERIRRKFYLNFCDQWIETIKLLSISPEALNRRFRADWSIAQRVLAAKSPAYLLIGHCFNWEWATSAMAQNIPGGKFVALYLPLTSPAFDRLMLKLRSRTGAVMVSMKNLKGGLQKAAGLNHVLGLAADQNPAVTEVADWISFMHRPAPFFRGPDQMPRRAKAPVMMGGVRKVKRGYYEATLEVLTMDASQLGQGEVLRAYVKFLEDALEAQPEIFLWSHRRWKHKPPVGHSA